MNLTKPIPFNPSERGAALIAFLLAQLIFSVLSLTVLKNPALETVLRTSDTPDLHVVLYAGGAASPEVIGRLNLPTISRLQGPVADESIELRVPGPGSDALVGDIEAGWAYAVQLTREMRVCCDNGDGACSRVTWDAQVPQGILSPTLDHPLAVTDTERALQFSLSSAEIADNVELDPKAVVESPFIVKATRIPEGSTPAQMEAGAVSCRLDTRETTLASGVLHLQPGVDRLGRVNRVSAGTLELNYRAPKK